MNKSLSKKRKMSSRPLTKSERFLLTTLGLVVLLWSSNRFILTPQAAKIDALVAQKTELDTTIIDMNNTLKREESIKKEWETLHRERNQVLTNYFPTLDQSQIIYLLNDLIAEDSVDISDLNFSMPSSETIGEIEVQQMGVSIPFDGSYDGIVEIVKSIGASPRRILVDTLSLDRKDNSDLGGTMSLKIYSLDGLAETDPNVIYVETANGTGEGSLFGAFGDYKEASNASGGTTSEGTTPGSSTTDGTASGGSGTNTTSGGRPSTSINDSDYTKVYLLHDFENRNYNFIPSSDMIKGDVSPSTLRKSGKYSLRFEYNMLALEEENRAYIDLSNSDIIFKYPPNSVSMWVNAFAYSPGTIGMRLRTQGGEDIDVTMSEGISWLGWSNIEAMVPEDLDLYPLQLTHLYFELPYNRDDFGVFLIDKLEAFYPVNEDSTVNNKPINDFYVVELGDTVTSISRKIYGTINYKNEIMTNNSLTAGDILTVGKVLVLTRR